MIVLARRLRGFFTHNSGRPGVPVMALRVKEAANCYMHGLLPSSLSGFIPSHPVHHGPASGGSRKHDGRHLLRYLLSIIFISFLSRHHSLSHLIL